jgi:hypothetical protein
LPRQGCQDSVASTGLLKQYGRNRKEKTSTGNVTGITGQADRKGGTGQAEQDWQNKTARTGLSGKNSRTGLPEQGCQHAAASTERPG